MYSSAVRMGSARYRTGEDTNNKLAEYIEPCNAYYTATSVIIFSRQAFYLDLPRSGVPFSSIMRGQNHIFFVL